MRLTQLLLSCSITITKLLNHQYFSVIKWLLLALGCYKTKMLHIFEWQNLLTWVKVLHHYSYEKQKTVGDIRCFDWMKLIDWYRLVNIDWLADIDWLDDLTCEPYSIRTKTLWHGLFNKGAQTLWTLRDPVYILSHALDSLCRPFWVGNMLWYENSLVYF